MPGPGQPAAQTEKMGGVGAYGETGRGPGRFRSRLGGGGGAGPPGGHAAPRQQVGVVARVPSSAGARRGAGGKRKPVAGTKAEAYATMGPRLLWSSCWAMLV